jgi:hypothetical protein
MPWADALGTGRRNAGDGAAYMAACAEAARGLYRLASGDVPVCAPDDDRRDVWWALARQCVDIDRTQPAAAYETHPISLCVPYALNAGPEPDAGVVAGLPGTVTDWVVSYARRWVATLGERLVVQALPGERDALVAALTRWTAIIDAVGEVQP